MATEKDGKRDAAGKILPGTVLNPGGRPKKEPSLCIKIREFDEVYRQRLHEIALTAEPRDSTAAIKLLWSYAHGQPAQRMILEGGDTPIQTQNLDKLSVEQLEQLEQIRKAAEGE